MVLCDFNMVVILSLMSRLNRNSNPPQITIDLIRSTALDTIRSYNKQFRDKYGNLVLCCDSLVYWRREYFPYYKAGRKKGRSKSNLDWKYIFDSIDALRAEFRTSLPYKLVEVNGAEADDVIATLVKEYHKQEPILIISSDKDFVQLQKYQNVKQYNPMFRRFVSVADPKAFIKEHIIRGDSGDGIPNFLSSDDVFVRGERQKSINTSKLVEWMEQDPSQFCVNDTMLRGYKRNETLIDFDCIPSELSKQIITEFKETKPVSRMKTMEYFMDHNLETLAMQLNEF